MHNEVKEGVFKKINSNNISLYRLDCIFQFTEKVTSGGAQSVEDPEGSKRFEKWRSSPNNHNFVIEHFY